MMSDSVETSNGTYNNGSSSADGGGLNEKVIVALYGGVLDCPDYSDRDAGLVQEFSFWVEGVSQTSIAVLGIIGNILASVILSR